MSNNKQPLRYGKKELDRLRELYPKAKHFVHVTLPEEKEITFTIEKRAPFKKGLADHINHLKKEYDYTDDDLQIETYDLRVK